MQFSRRGVAVGSLAPSLVCGCVEGGSAFDLSASQRDLSAISEEERIRSRCDLSARSRRRRSCRGQRARRGQRHGVRRGVTCVPSTDRDSATPVHTARTATGHRDTCLRSSAQLVHVYRIRDISVALAGGARSDRSWGVFLSLGASGRNIVEYRENINPI